MSNYDYRLVCASNVIEFEREVTKLLNEGYTFHGVRTVDINDAGKVFYTQAMINETTDYEDSENVIIDGEY